MTMQKRAGELGVNRNLDEKTIQSFGNEWSSYRQDDLPEQELRELFELYFHIFPWDSLSEGAEGFDMGCGSGRWARFVAPRVGKLHCVDASSDALAVARQNLSEHQNVNFVHATTETVPFDSDALDFGYSLGVLHHIPDTFLALRDCLRLLKPGAPMLIYLYYRFDNRSLWFRFIWAGSDLLRRLICRLPDGWKSRVTDALAILIYWPLSRFAKLVQIAGLDPKHIPLASYRDSGFTTLKTDSRDRFGTPLEQRFTRQEIEEMMQRAGLENIRFSDNAPYWCAVGTKSVG